MDEQRASQQAQRTVDKYSSAAAPADVSNEEALLQRALFLYMDSGHHRGR